MQYSETKELADEIRAQLSEVPSANREYCIGRVRRRLREAHRILYIPMTISIGPLHHSRSDLSAMEKYKQQYTKSFLEQSPHLFLEDYLKALQGLVEKTRKCYGEEINLSSKKFKKMMLYDGCFIIELFLRFKKEVPGSEDDPIFRRIGLLNRIKRDMILFENQLPFFVLQCLFNLSTVFNGGPSLIELALHFFSDIIPGHRSIPQEQGADLKHLLDLLRHSYAPSWIDANLMDDDPELLMYSATDLKLKAAVKFRTASKAGSLLDIKFHSNGLMEIPRLKLQAETETLFRNFMAFEQCCERSNAYITDYISFMGCLIKAWDDADLLCDAGIIESHLPWDPLAITDLFRTLSKELIVYNCYYSRLCKRMSLRCIRPRQPWPLTETLTYDCSANLKILGFLLVFMWLVWLHLIFP
ncbi:hypothetical protein P3X46_008600 [Hevea brasiliensis]|uniref:Uncharacterized protein n=1 Tax=Hevea brasiliensis TaxID=3981 RepID=A0ABQ9MLK4_HEVBR|nr:UPF0481 protein At3g47200 [Hevea brasiliensis]XP_058003827.1 UPF0481 protein At3g47200 [Hevea brasiliensis]KAJ9180342.1 hypothetical protein P3X46_008600 [Hevea brasiliensis]